MYLLTTGEIYADCLTSSCADSASFPHSGYWPTVTRQLDYYAGGFEINSLMTTTITKQNCNKNNRNMSIKTDGTENRVWWL